MLKIIKDKWNKNESLLRTALAEGSKFNCYQYMDMVKLAFSFIFNDGTLGNYEGALDLDGLTEIDDGDYQGTLLYLIPFKTYQPAEYEYLMTYVGYGYPDEHHQTL